MIRSIIIDDEKHCRDYLIELLKKEFSEIEVVGEADNANEGIQVIIEKNPDLLFCDIQMPDNNGFSILENEEIKKLKSLNVIFITAHDNYAIKALRYAAIDYLLKPVNVDELSDAIQRYKKLTEEKNDFSKKHDLIRYINQTQNFDKICLPSRHGMEFVKINDIEYVEAQGSYTIIHVENEKDICVSKPILSFEKLLPENQFIRVHRSFMVNIEKIKSYNSLENCVIITGNLKVEVSVRKKAELLEVLSRYKQP